jgi:hypothetical protein
MNRNNFMDQQHLMALPYVFKVASQTDIPLEGRRSLDFPPLIQWVKNFIGQWTDTSLRAILVVVFGQFARDLLAVHTVADVLCAVGLVDISLLHNGILLSRG